jgi:hypothetical protein
MNLAHDLEQPTLQTMWIDIWTLPQQRTQHLQQL